MLHSLLQTSFAQFFIVSSKPKASFNRHKSTSWNRFALLFGMLLSIFIYSGSAQAASNFQTDSYTIYTDGTNLYLKATERFIPIGTDIIVPILITDGPHLKLTPKSSTDANAGYDITTIDPFPTGLTQVYDLDVLIGDFDGEGTQDLLLVPNTLDSDSSRGAVVVVFGTYDAVPTYAESYTQLQGVNVVSAIISVSDVNGDGQDEIVLQNEHGLTQVADYSAGTFLSERLPKSAIVTGNTPTSFEVTYGGAASYQVPLNVPAGAAGISPSLAFSYNSQYGNTVMGLGWNLSTGMAQISECYQRNTTTKIHCLNGEELYSVGGDYYRTKLDMGILIHRVSDSQYTLHYENGSLKTLNRKLANPSVYLEEIYQQRGGANYNVTWDVDTTNREPLVSAINYQGNSIQFNYEDRSDSRKGYQMGAPRNRTQRLVGITAKADNTITRQYEVFYEQDTVSGLSKVTNIQECAGLGECLEPLSFEWVGSGQQGLSTGVNSPGQTHWLANLNNDGRIDGVDRSGTGKTVHTSQGSESGVASRAWSEFIGGSKRDVITGDINGDGRDDLVYVETDGDIYYKLNNGSSFIDGNGSSNGKVTSDEPEGRYSLVDIDGDGYSDLISYISTETKDYSCVADISTTGNYNCKYDFTLKNYVRVRKGSATGLSHSYNDHTLVDITQDGTVWTRFGSIRGDTTTYPANRYRVNYNDVNGDGLPDFVIAQVSNPNKISIRLNQGNGTFSLSAIETTFDVGVDLVDLNGDGYLDAFARDDGKAYVHYGDGLGHFIPLNDGNGDPAVVISSSYINKHADKSDDDYEPNEIRFIDLNADGLSDLWIYSKSSDSTYRVAYNLGDGRFSSLSSSPFYNSLGVGINRSTGDINGDGVTDLFHSDIDAPYANQTKVLLGQAKRPYITAFNDSYGNQHTVEYSRLTDSDVYTRDDYDTANVGDTHPYQQATTVVKSITTPNDTVYYKYAGARMHNGEYGYLGFSSITSALAKKDETGTDVALVTTSYLHQDYPLVGKLKRVNKKVYGADISGGLAASKAISGIEYTYDDNVEPGVLIAKMSENVNLLSFELNTKNSIDVAVVGISANIISTVNNVTGTDFTGQMNSTFEWQTIDLAGGVKKAVLKEKTVDHIQLESGDLLKRDITKATWQTVGGQYARLTRQQMLTENSNRTTLSTNTTDYTYENTDTYGLSTSFLVDTSTRSTQTPADSLLGLVNDTHTIITEYDYYSSGSRKGLIKDQWLNKTDAKGIRTAYGYDGYGNITSNTISAANPTGASDSARPVTLTYSHNGKYLNTESNALGHTTTYSQYTANGQPGKMEDAKGLVVYTYYDAFGRQTRTYDYLGNESFTTRGLCNSGLGCTNDAYQWEKSTPAGGAQAYQYWDKQGRLVKTAVQSHDGSWQISVSEYDRFGRMSAESVPQLASLTTTIGMDANNATQYTYDELSRVVNKNLPGNRTVSTSYTDEKAVAVTDPGDRTWLTYTNALGQTIAKGRGNGVFNGIDPSTRISFIYDAQGNVLEQRYPKLDANGNLTTGNHKIVNTYDRYGNHTSLNDPNTGQWHYQYNAYAEVIQQTDGNGNVTRFTYDLLGRALTQQDNDTYSLWTYDQEEIGLLDTVQQYDISSVSNKSTLTPSNVASRGGVLSYQQALDYYEQSKLPERTAMAQRDANNALAQSEQTHQYDRYGRLSQQTLPAIYKNKNQEGLSAPQLDYHYNAYGYLDEITDANSNAVYQNIHSVDAWGNITDQTINGNIKQLRSYDANTGWIRTLDAYQSNANSWLISQEYQQYNALGLMGEKVDHISYTDGRSQTWVETYHYDDALAQQLTQANIRYQRSGFADEDWAHCYRYDALGNMREQSNNLSHNCANASAQTTSTYQYASGQPHQLQSVSGELTRNYSYDGNGNVLNDGLKTLGYYSFNKVKTVQQGNLTTRFEYGADRSRTLRVDTEGSKTTETLYVGSYERVATGSDVEHRYTIGGVVQLVQTESTVSQGTQAVHALISDYQQTLLAVTDDNGDIQQRYRYTPFGGDRADVSDANQAEVTTRGYTDHEHIEGTDVIHMNGRIYDGAINRFLQADPVVQAPNFVLSYNRYAYVWNNPVNATDPTGYEMTGDPGGLTFGQTAGNARAEGRDYDYGTESGETPAINEHLGGNDHGLGSIDPTLPPIYEPNNSDVPRLWPSHPDGTPVGYCNTCPDGGNAAGIDWSNVVGELWWAAQGLPVAKVGHLTKTPTLLGSLFSKIGSLFGFGAKSGLSSFSRASEFGIKSYKDLKKLTKGTGLEAHHLVEQRFAKMLGVKPRDMASIALTKVEHQVFTNAWRKAIPYGQGTANATRDQVMNAARQIYKDSPDILKSLDL